MQGKFAIGQLVATAGVVRTMEESKAFEAFAKSSFRRYLTGDWGELDASDKASNDSAVANNDDRILAAYTNAEHPEWKLWIITEWDRSATTLLFPSEY